MRILRDGQIGIGLADEAADAARLATQGVPELDDQVGPGDDSGRNGPGPGTRR